MMRPCVEWLPQVMGMIPGFSNALAQPGHEKESQAKIKRFMCIMDSMTDKELDSPEPKILAVRRGHRGVTFRVSSRTGLLSYKQ